MPKDNPTQLQDVKCEPDANTDIHTDNAPPIPHRIVQRSDFATLNPTHVSRIFPTMTIVSVTHLRRISKLRD
jgi:hypothetical protein